MFDAIRRLFSDRRSDESLIMDAYDHHLADLRNQLDEEKALNKQLMEYIMGRDKPSTETPVALQPRRNWRDVQRRLEEKDREYAESRRTDSEVLLGEKSAKQD